MPNAHRARSPVISPIRVTHAQAKLALGLLASSLWLAACAADPYLLDSDATTGFAIYCSGRLGAGELAALCRAGVEEIVVLDGTAGRRECVLRHALCPGLRVRYDGAQAARVPLTREFLDAFDRWVSEARSEGRRIAVRCRRGWHRTGRLAAYYRMRFEGWTAEEASREMHRLGRFMAWHPRLDDQVEAFDDVLHERPCRAAPASCVAQDLDDPEVNGSLFPPDACRQSSSP